MLHQLRQVRDHGMRAENTTAYTCAFIANVDRMPQFANEHYPPWRSPPETKIIASWGPPPSRARNRPELSMRVLCKLVLTRTQCR